ncbi:MAG TPA: hypothetical protein VK702_12210 [Candidatus Acidoferrum sp.]|nr:hypothetical protein [Candidatus Acidoferrum sp.]
MTNGLDNALGEFLRDRRTKLDAARLDIAVAEGARLVYAAKKSRSAPV